MRKLAASGLFAALISLGTPLAAGVTEAIEGHILPRHEAFAKAGAALSEAAQADCTSEALRPAYNSAFDAWLGVAHMALGPLQDMGGPLVLEFWPDTKGFTQRQLGQLIAAANPEAVSTEGFAHQSVAVQGFLALEMMLYDERFAGYDAQSYSCQLVQAIAGDIAKKATTLQAEWRKYGALMESAGEAGNTTYLAPEEAAQALFTALIGGLEFNDDKRLGRPLGSFERSRPRRAEAWRSARSQRNLRASLVALEEFSTLLADGQASETAALFRNTVSWLDKLDEPSFAGVSLPGKRLGIESLRSYLTLLEETAAVEISEYLQVEQGFNALDGD